MQLVEEESDFPTLIHITHWKAGSQWIHRILRNCFADRIVPPALGNTQFIKQRILPNKIYPTVYVTREEFNTATLPNHWRRFIVIRDLRDTLISGYFSIKFSHPPMGIISEWRDALNKMEMEQGLLFLMDVWLPDSVSIQRSWLNLNEPLIRYEDLLIRDVELMKQIILNDAQLPITTERLEQIILESRFENVTGGRKLGEENKHAHERKGVAGDWKNFFTPKLKKVFKEKFGELLIATGYERRQNW